MKVSVSKETEQQVFSIEATGIKTADDVKEIIRQCQLVEGQITDGLGNGLFKENVFLAGKIIPEEGRLS